MKSGYSPVILITGGTNSGKTCLGALICEFIDYMLNKIIWTPEDKCIFDMDTFSKKFLGAWKTPFLIAEASYDLNYDAWYSKSNKFFDKIVTTQRVRQNLYIMNVPVAKDLARRQRRKVDYIIDIKRWGVAKVYNVNVRRKELYGNEFKPYWIADLVGYPLPKCHKQLKKFDEENKAKIHTALDDEFKHKIELETQRKDLKKIEYKCAICKYIWNPRVPFPKRCPECNNRLRYKDVQEDRLKRIRT